VIARSPSPDVAARFGYQVRDMVAADVGAVAEVHVRVWRQAYAGLVPEQILRDLSIEDKVEAWRQAVRQPATGTRHVVGLSPDGEIVGIATAGPSRDRPPIGEVELWMLNVLASHHGSGLADAMMDTLLGDRPASLWVLRGNDRAIAFYRRHGFDEDGSQKAHRRTGTSEVRMVRPVPDA
jgi:ribosomal protein S18 acetylase RimI-like enzyme